MLKLVLIHTDEKAYGSLARTLPPALFPVLNRPLVRWQLEHGYSGGIREATLIVSSGLAAVRKSLGEGRRFGVRLDIRIGESGAGETESLLKHRSLFDSAMLVQCGAVDVGLDIPALLEAHNESGCTISIVCDKSSRVPLAAILEPGADRILAGHAGGLLDLLLYLQEQGDKAIGLLFQDKPFVKGEGLMGLLELNSNLLRRVDPLRTASFIENPKGVFVGRGTHIHPKAKIVPPVMIGHYSQIMAGASIGPDALLGENTIVDRRATVLSSLVHENSYVGAMTRIEKSLVIGNRLFNLESGIKLVITDPFLLGGISRFPVGDVLDSGAQRMLALGLLVATAPLGLAIAAKALRRYGEPLGSREILGAGSIERSEDLDYLPRFQMLSWPSPDLPAPWWPRLINVVKGHMNLVGPRPLSPEQAKQSAQSWMLKRFGLAPGLIGVAELSDGDESESTVAERIYTERKSPLLDAKVVLANIARPLIGKLKARKILGF